MLKFSKDQMLAFEQANWRNLVQGMARRLGDAVPQLLSRLGERDLLQAVHQNANIAYTQFGLREDDDLEAYVSYAARLGSGFTTDIVVYWAEDILTDDGFVLMSEKMSFLETNMMDHFVKAFGPDMPWAPCGTYERYAAYLRSPNRSANVSGQAVSTIETIWPERAALCEFRQLHDFCAEAASLADAYGLTRNDLQNRFAVMAFVFGARFDVDVFNPWAAAILQGSTASPEAMIDQLEMASLTHAIYPWIGHPDAEEYGA